MKPPFHVYPLDDVDDHILDERCWCRPRREHVDPRTGKWHDEPIIVHRRMKDAN